MRQAEETRREKVLNVKFFNREHETLQKVARLDGLTMSDFIRQAALKRRREFEAAGQWA